jgi:ABC-type uncharacterized transport system permease subunit
MELFASIIATTLRLSVPVMLAAIGCSFSTKAGVTAFGCEGMMAAGAIFATIGAYYSGNRWVGVFVGLVAGLFMSLIHGVLHIRFRVNATLSGMGVNLLGVATATLLLKLVWNEEGFSPPTDAFSKLSATPPFTGIAKIPLIGGVLGEQSIYLLFCIVFIILGWVYMYRTTFGLRMRMVGENPVAAHSVGINTVRYKYFGVIMCGLLAGLGAVAKNHTVGQRYNVTYLRGNAATQNNGNVRNSLPHLQYVFL